MPAERPKRACRKRKGISHSLINICFHLYQLSAQVDNSEGGVSETLLRNVKPSGGVMG